MEFRIIALDMDGTLLDAAGQIPDSFWPVLDELRARDVAVAPASGRQLATLQAIFPGDTFIAENGTCVFHDGEIVSTTLLDDATVHAVINVALAADMDLVVCTPTVAYHRPDISAESLQRKIPDVDRHDVFMCGPPGFAQSVYDALRGAGVPARRIHHESFEM